MMTPSLDNMFDLSGKVALVTGGSRGIGRAISLRLAQHGATVVVSSRKVEACQEVVDEIRCGGGEAEAKACNIAEKGQLQALVEHTVEKLGGVDVLVCNAAVNPYFGPSNEMSDEAFDRVMGCNVRSNFQLVNMAIPSMLERGGGSIIVISSIGGFIGSDVLGAYSISKAADMQLVRNIAVEWGGKNVRANCIAPGLIRTDFARALWENEKILESTLRNTPMKRIGEADEIAGAAVFLASPAAGYMNGQTLAVDGGRLAGVPRAQLSDSVT
ncbi:7-alpha-hydroxysteroid dehydrogenase [Paraburkholderia piptadeniae]|uniref:7-alpha-hydroxysteroid dehydrogenase n=1 Tax=Paraburkholderia piptadeniae TaxID=1701573 RepID=A0A1N7SE74_9BURK|nr:glucose 1-dehydrogenase [Paraburkholderia piptadeniae]SIT45644.1 7-alpha-hydroxysteroid dehydrogenase [Paraburkholderia piptadeniae]